MFRVLAKNKRNNTNGIRGIEQGAQVGCFVSMQPCNGMSRLVVLMRRCSLNIMTEITKPMKQFNSLDSEMGVITGKSEISYKLYTLRRVHDYFKND
jgi:hypothetical protein